MKRIELFFTLVFLATAAQGSQIVNPAASGGGSGSSIYPSTATASFPFGADFSSGTVQTEAVISTGIPNLGQVNNISFPNIVRNGGFETWRAGTNGSTAGVCTAAPTNYVDAWTAVFNCTSANTVGILRASSPVKYGTYSLEINTVASIIGGSSYYIKQTIPNFTEYAGSSVTLSGWVNITVNGGAANVAMTIDDGVTVSTSSSLSSADSTWHFISVTKFISATPTQLLLKVGSLTSGTAITVFFDGISLVRGDVATDYAPPNYSETMSQIQTDPAGGIIGTPTNDSATPGDVGEYVSATAASVSAASNGTYGNVATIVVSSGDWDVSGAVLLAGSTATGGQIYVSLFSGNTTTDQVLGYNDIYINSGATGTQSGVVPLFRVATATAVTVYLKGRADYTTGSPLFFGGIEARRRR